MKFLSTLFAAALMALGSSLPGLAQTTAFTYQGFLTDNGAPANGTHDIQFRLFNAATSGAQQGGPVTLEDIGVTNGLFTVTLDFGAAAFSGADRWLDIAVRPGASTGSYTNLLPRQPITSTPYAVRAAESSSVAAGAVTSAMLADGAVTAAKLAPGAVFQLSAPDASPANAVVVNANGLVGIGTGTNAPAAGLHVAGGADFLAPKVRFQVVDGTGSYTNLAGAADIALSGSLLAIAAAADSAVTLVDASNPASPVLRAQIRDGQGTFTNLAGARAVAFSFNRLNSQTRLAIAASQDSAVTLVDVSNPSLPVKLSELRDGIGGFNELNGLQDVAFSGNLLAIAAFQDSAVTLVDVSNPASPVLRAVLKDGQSGYNDLGGALRVVFSSNLLAIGAYDESAVTLVDVSNPSSPVLRAVLKDGVGGFDRLGGVAGLAFSGDLLAIAGQFENTVSLVDVSNPSNPVLRSVLQEGVGGFDRFNGLRGLAFSGNLLAIAADLDDAVTLADVSNPAMPVARGVFKNLQDGLYNFDGPSGLVFSGATLAVCSGSGSLTLLEPVAATAAVTVSGRMGIGTSLPAAPLHVVGNVLVDGGDQIDLRAPRVALGNDTTASGDTSTAMGRFTTASGNNSTAMGYETTASGGFSTAMGGFSTASGFYSTAMGRETLAAGTHSMAAGWRAKANHTGSFVWADSSGADFESTAANQFSIRASGGVRIDGGTDAEPAGGGFLTLGSTATSNLVLDNNEIMARNNGAVARLSLNFDGGEVVTGGPLGVDRAPVANALEVSGNASKTTAGSWLANSDARIKQQVETVTDALDTLHRVRLVSFRYDDAYLAHNDAIEDRSYVNVIAQEFAGVFPEHVQSSGEKLPDGSEVLQVDIHPLTIYSAAAVQELDRKVEARARESAARILKLEAENTALKARLEKLEQLLTQPFDPNANAK